MTTQHKTIFDPDIYALLEQSREIQPVPDLVRARALARARSTMLAAGAIPVEPLIAVGRRGLAIALAASVALAVVTASAVAAFYNRTPHDLPVPLAPPAESRQAAPMPAFTLDMEESPSDVPAASLSAKPQRSVRLARAQESYAAELELLQHVQAAYKRQSFATALSLVAEHGRRFPRGRLTEEREVLRIRSLIGAGRMDDARAVAVAFTDRFPRSVFLPRLSKELR